MQELFTQYYGLDWLGMIMVLLCVYYIGNKKRYAFIFGLIGCLIWIYVNHMANIIPAVLLNIVLFILYLRGYIKWGKDDK